MRGRGVERELVGSRENINSLWPLSFFALIVLYDGESSRVYITHSCSNYSMSYNILY